MFPALPAPASAAPAPRPRPATTGQVLLVALIWSVPLAALFFLGFLVLMVSVWSAASGESPVSFLLGAAGVLAAGAAVLTGLYRSPPLRRMTPMGRLSLLGAMVWPFPVVTLAYALNG
ncbi:hypothetical protein OG379_18130 [Streptomyces sp. NBC_01166]|uniref:hypothetical protein n=1 Tax=Streptomyces sp. NBC_01166 TaxID=2903755 RepID=UPI00386F2C62|nr:hypothetical protein OG379_18130 [Streptomyces sp. NBC_01166]